jgi:hypothetical protein
MFKQAATRGSKKPKARKKKSDTFVYRERKEREYKPKNTYPAPFYTTSRKGYGWCDGCKDNSINALNGLILTCENGHNTTLVKSENYTLTKGQPKKEVDVISLGSPKYTLLMI